MDIWEPSGHGYELHGMAGGIGRFLLVYCGGAFGYTAHRQWSETAPYYEAFYSVWDTLNLVYGDHPWLTPQRRPPWGVISLAYGKGGTFIDGGFGNAFPVPPASLSIEYLGNFPPSSGIPLSTGTFPPDGTPYPAPNLPPGAKYVGLGTDSNGGNANDQAAAQLAQDRFKSAIPVNASGCVYYPFKSDGTAGVSMEFSAPLYMNDIWPTNPGDPAGPPFMIKSTAIGGPKFALIKKLPLFVATQVCGGGGFGGSNQYVVNLLFRNDSDFYWDGVANLIGSGIAVTSGQGQAWTVPPHQVTHVSFAINVSSKTSPVVLTLSDEVGTIQTMNYVITPLFVGVTATSLGTSFFNTSQNRVRISVDSAVGLGFADVWLQFSLSGGIVGFFDDNTGAALPSPWDTFQIMQGCEAGARDFVLNIATAAVRPASVVLTFSVLDDGVPSSMPPFSFTVPLLWT